MKTYEVEIQVIETYVVEAENPEVAQRRAKLFHSINCFFNTTPELLQPQREIVSVVAEPTPNPPTEL